ncbi:MAG TPA: DUF2207 domain-containing protein [Exilispira sp.]|nr:DUF2207 domain-containing protein [Exilispira sp.]
MKNINREYKKLYLFYLFIFILFLFLSLFFFSFSSFQNENKERILFFDSVIMISQTGQLTIHETIVVESFNIEINHGIYRDLPLYENSKSFIPKSLGLKVIEGKLDGNHAIFKIEEKNGFKRIYLGYPDQLLSTGIHTFEILYSYDNSYNTIIKTLNDEQLLYLNITGNNWNFPILKATATIVFPQLLFLQSDFIFTKIEAYTGAKGSTENNYVFSMDKNKPNILFFETTNPLNKYEGLTVFIKWKSDVLLNQEEDEKEGFQSIFVKTFKKIKLFYSINPSLFLLFLFTIFIFLYYIITWSIVGKDPKKMKIPPSTNIIERLSPCAIRYIWEMGFDVQCLSTAIISMASKGYLNIEFNKSGFILNKTENEVELSEDEKIIANSIFAEDKKSYNFIRENYSKNQSIIKKLKNHLQENYKNIYFVTNSSYYIIGLILSIIVFLISMIKTVFTFEAGFILLWLSIWSFGVIALISAAIKAWKTRKISGKTNAIILTLFSIPFVAAEIFVFLFFINQVNSGFLFLNFVFAMILIIINIIYFKLLKRPTKEGISIYEEIEALKRFLLNIPKDLKNQKAEINLQIDIDKLLPYALALDLEKDWFSSVLQPDYLYNSGSYVHTSSFFPWIISGNFNNFSEIKNFFSYLSSTIANNSSSSSSSSSGGGSSGGGFGGGGGGGW